MEFHAERSIASEVLSGRDESIELKKSKVRRYRATSSWCYEILRIAINSSRMLLIEEKIEMATLRPGLCKLVSGMVCTI